MKKVFQLFIVISIVFASASPLSARRGRPGGVPDNMIESLLKYKHDFITKRLELTREQQNKFFPLYDKMTDEINDIHADANDVESRLLKSSENVTDLDYQMATTAFIEKGEKIANIEKKYYESFKDILSPKQLFLLKVCEKEINKKIIEHLRKENKSVNASN